MQNMQNLNISENKAKLKTIEIEENGGGNKWKEGNWTFNGMNFGLGWIFFDVVGLVDELGGYVGVHFVQFGWFWI